MARSWRAIRGQRPLNEAQVTAYRRLMEAELQLAEARRRRGVSQAAIADATQAPLDENMRGVDGCSIPTYAIPLRALARGLARFATGQGLSPARAQAAERIRAAVAAHPALVAGPGRFDTEVMTILGRRAFTKAGAEGVFCAALPALGLGIAVKADDGGARAAQAMTAALLSRFGAFGDALNARLARFITPRIVNWNGFEVGVLRPAGPLARERMDL